MFVTSKEANPNYLAKVFRLPEPRKHTNADRLQCVTVDGNNVITGLDALATELYVFFPLECVINKDFLSWSNAFADKTMNANPEVKGFFNNKGRVRALRLRGERSEGYIVPLHSIAQWLKEKYGHNDVLAVAKEGYCDSFGEILLCEKYVIPTKNVNRASNRQHKSTRHSKLVPGQFNLHVDTQQFKKYTEAISGIDLLSITYKVHGTSFVVGKVLTNKKLRWWEKGLRKLGVPIQDTIYDTIYASRKVVKNAYDEGYEPNHFFGYDLWKDIADQLEPYLTEGLTLYGEAVGFTKNGAYIQKDYDYGCKPGEMKLFIYRITSTNTSGKVFEFSTQQTKRYCENLGLNYVPQLYYGPADLLSPYFAYGADKQLLLAHLSEMYLEKDCWMCNNVVPAEGVVLRRETSDIEAYKLKSFRFLEFETAALDNDEGGLEE